MGKIVEHYFFCLPVREQTTGEFVFSKLDEFMENEHLSWSKCVAVITDGAAAMMGETSRIKEPPLASKNNPRIAPFYIVVYIGKHWLPTN